MADTESIAAQLARRRWDGTSPDERRAATAPAREARRAAAARRRAERDVNASA